MTTVARKRLLRDLKKLQADPPSGISAAPQQDDIMSWTAVIFGPEDTPWEGGAFQLLVTFNEEFPTKPPHIRFVTKMFHPNIYANGEICLDILQNQWSPIYDISAILTSIQSTSHIQHSVFVQFLGLERSTSIAPVIDLACAKIAQVS